MFKWSHTVINICCSQVYLKIQIKYLVYVTVVWFCSKADVNHWLPQTYNVHWSATTLTPAAWSWTPRDCCVVEPLVLAGTSLRSVHSTMLDWSDMGVLRSCCCRKHRDPKLPPRPALVTSLVSRFNFVALSVFVMFVWSQTYCFHINLKDLKYQMFDRFTLICVKLWFFHNLPLIKNCRLKY